MPRKKLWPALLLLSVLMLGCNAGANRLDDPTTGPSTTTSSATEGGKTGASTEMVNPEATPDVDRIGIRLVDGIGEFYNINPGDVFIPRGVQ